MNTVQLIGRLTKVPELRYTQSGVATTSFTLAVNRNFTNANGEREADFIMCTAWRKTAELVCQYLNKGSLVGINGRIQTRNYENQQGQRVYVTEVIVDELTFVESKNKQGNQNNGYQQGNNFSQNNQNYNQNNCQQNQYQNNNQNGYGQQNQYQNSNQQNQYQNNNQNGYSQQNQANMNNQQQNQWGQPDWEKLEVNEDDLPF